MKNILISRLIWMGLGIIIAAFILIFLKRELPIITKKAHQLPVISSLLSDQLETTFAIIKPDAVMHHDAGDIIKLIELNDFEIKYLQKVQLTREQAEQFYAVHKERSFYHELVTYMTSGPVIIMALTKENAIKEWRELMGATNPAQAAPGTIRRMFGTDITHNATHGSDSVENAHSELNYFFKS